MAASVTYMDFSRLYVSDSEMKLLREICDKPLKRKAADRTEEAERLAELGLIEVFENRDKGRQGLFATETGRAYLEYAGRVRRTRLLGILKWLIPLILAVAALALAIRANSLVGWGAGRTSSTSGQSYQQKTTATTNASTNNSGSQTSSSKPQSGTNSNQAASSEQTQTPGTAQAQGQPQGVASGEASGEISDE